MLDATAGGCLTVGAFWQWPALAVGAFWQGARVRSGQAIVVCQLCITILPAGQAIVHYNPTARLDTG